jgi:hypothetical protein
MQSNQMDFGYKIWAVDGVVYGPVELPTLISWIKDERVLPETWIFDEQNDQWRKAGEIQILNQFFGTPVEHSGFQTTASIRPGALRRVKILADLNEQQLERFAQLMEVQCVRPFETIVRQNEPGDGMFLVLEGELRVRLMIDGKESILAVLGPGEFFGEMALFDNSPRSADVLANQESLLLKISRANFDRLVARAPELAAPFIFSISKTLAARIRADNRRFKDSVHAARAL